MDYSTYGAEDTDNTTQLFDLYSEENLDILPDESSHFEESQAMALTNKLLQRIVRTEKQIQESLERASEERQEFVQVLTKQIEKEHEDQCAQMDKLCAKFKQDNVKSKVAKIEKMKELLAKIDNNQEMYKTKKISEMQRELNAVLLKIKSPSPPSEMPQTRHSVVIGQGE